MSNTTEDSLTTAELAARWRLDPATLRNWRFRGIGPRYFKPRGSKGKVLYKLKDIRAWEEKHTVGGDEWT